MPSKDKQSPTIVRKIALLLVLFYATYYALVGIVYFAMGLSVRYDSPWQTSAFNPAQSGEPRAAFVCMVLTYVLHVGQIFKVVRFTPMCWDYALTISTLHCILTLAIGTRWVSSGIWWGTWAGCSFLLGLGSEMATYRLHDLRDIQVDH